MSSTHSIPAPLNTPYQADLVIKTGDDAHLYVVKAFLIYASTFFAHLFADSSPDETYQGIPLYRVPETCRTMVSLLQLCYPAYLVSLDIVGAHIDRALMEAMEKYVMEGVYNHLKAIMEKDEMVKQNPLKMYAVARHLRWDDLTRAAARECLNIDFLATGPKDIPELDMITGNDYIILLRYFRSCAEKVKRLLFTICSGSDPMSLPPPRSLESISCVYPHLGTTIMLGGIRIHSWLKTSLEEIDVYMCPGRGVLDRKVADNAIVKAAKPNSDGCGYCDGIGPTTVVTILEYIQAEVDKIISTVCPLYLAMSVLVLTVQHPTGQSRAGLAESPFCVFSLHFINITIWQDCVQPMGQSREYDWRSQAYPAQNGRSLTKPRVDVCVLCYSPQNSLYLTRTILQICISEIQIEWPRLLLRNRETTLFGNSTYIVLFGDCEHVDSSLPFCDLEYFDQRRAYTLIHYHYAPQLWPVCAHAEDTCPRFCKQIWGSDPPVHVLYLWECKEEWHMELFPRQMPNHLQNNQIQLAHGLLHPGVFQRPDENVE